ncbi:MAG: A/G-specific adenine glycosylase [Acholeplasmataceae bacterium]
MGFKQLHHWYKKNKRILPFRETQDPYAIWAAEIMLQQTQVVTMLPYYEAFLARFKDIQSLASVTFDDVLPYVRGLGYYRRFRLMHQAAIFIQEHYKGQFPTDYKDVRALPGIGDYTAGAIMSTAFKKPYSALDGNVMRVLTRVFMIDDDIKKPKTIKTLNQLNQSLINVEEPDIYTHAMMELGATVCKPTQPNCQACPLNDICQSYEHQVQHLYPFKSKSQAKKQKQLMTCIITDEHDRYLIKKETQSLFEGMYLFLQVESESIHYTMEWLESMGIVVDYMHPFKKLKHVFTHQVWYMDVHHFKLKTLQSKDVDLVAFNDDKFSMMPTAHLKIYKFLK